MSLSPKRIDTEDLAAHLDDSAPWLVDIRSADAYNGWRLRGENRGGHIPGARSLPAKWMDYIDWPDIVSSKGISPDRDIILYGYSRDDVLRTADRFQRIGFPKVFLYPDFLSHWCADPVYPLERLERYHHLVPASWVHKLIQQGEADEYENDSFVICHAHYQNPEDYRQGHIPGSLALDTNSLESPETWNRRTPEEVKRVLLSLGITARTSVILYGRFSQPDFDDPFPGSSAGQLAAMRCAFIMLWAGVRDVRILNGGLQSWLDAGYRLSTEDAAASQGAEDFGGEVPASPHYAVDLPGAREILADPEADLVSVRSWPEYIGEVSGYHYIQKKGRIPGAVFGNCGSDAYHMENYRNLDHTMREYPEIEKMWGETGLSRGRRTAFYCGTGWRGSEAFFCAWLMGWPRVSVYDGGWFEWSADETNPVETGPPA